MGRPIPLPSLCACLACNGTSVPFTSRTDCQCGIWKRKPTLHYKYEPQSVLENCDRFMTTDRAVHNNRLDIHIVMLDKTVKEAYLNSCSNSLQSQPIQPHHISTECSLYSTISIIDNAYHPRKLPDSLNLFKFQPGLHIPMQKAVYLDVFGRIMNNQCSVSDVYSSKIS